MSTGKENISRLVADVGKVREERPKKCKARCDGMFRAPKKANEKGRLMQVEWKSKVVGDW